MVPRATARDCGGAGAVPDLSVGIEHADLPSVANLCLCAQAGLDADGPAHHRPCVMKHRTPKWVISKTWLAVVTFSSVAASALPASAESTEAPAPPTRSVWVAANYAVLLTSAFEPSSRHGLGASGAYEFHVTPRFNLGLTLAYRLYPGSTATQQLGYGATLKHFFTPAWSTRDGVYPFVDYGLLLQQSFVSDREGSATSHDTRLGVGLLARMSSASLFVDVAGHYSRLNYFDMKGTWIPYLETRVGWVFTL